MGYSVRYFVGCVRGKNAIRYFLPPNRMAGGDVFLVAGFPNTGGEKSGRFSVKGGAESRMGEF